MMFLCPVSSNRLRPAFARGVNIWYSPESGGRLITFAAARKILGEDVARELWVRSDLKGVVCGWKKCPSCSHEMRIVNAPKWAGAFEVDVCRNCHIIWLDQDEFPAVPGHEDLISHYGDASLVASVVHDQAKILVEQHKKENPSLFGEGPESLWKSLPAFIGMPVEMDDEKKYGSAWLTWIIGALLVIIHFGLIDKFPFFLNDWALLPAEPFRQSGLTLISWGFLHADAFHLFSNLYFFGVFADDVEVYYGKTKFLFLIFGCLLFSSFILILTQYHADIPHVGLSGVICAIMVNYGLIYRKARIAYLMPYMHTNGSGQFMRAVGWVRLASIWVIAGFVLKDLVYYVVFELSEATRVSHSGHLLGALLGFGFWFLNGCPNWYYDTLPKDETTIKDRLLPYK